MRKALLFVFFLINLHASAHADNFEFGSQTLEMLRWKADLAKSAYNLRSSSSKLGEFVSVQERLVTFLCAPNIFVDLEFEGNPTDQECLSELEKLVEVDANNPVAACIRQGTSSAACSAAFGKQVVEDYQAFYAVARSDRAAGEEFRQQTLRIAPALDKLWQKVSALDSSLNNQNTKQSALALRRKLGLVFEQILRIGCSVEKLNFEQRADLIPRTRFQFATNKQKYNLGAASKLQAELERQAASKQSKTARSAATAKTQLVRVRYISSACKRAIETITTRDPQNPYIYCGFHGSFSPQCLKALRQRRGAKNFGFASESDSSKDFVPLGAKAQHPTRF